MKRERYVEKRRASLKRTLEMFRARPADTAKQEARILKQLERLEE